MHHLSFNFERWHWTQTKNKPSMIKINKNTFKLFNAQMCALRTTHPRECNTQNKKNEKRGKEIESAGTERSWIWRIWRIFISNFGWFPTLKCWHFKLFVNKIPWHLRQRSGFLFHSLFFLFFLLLFRLYQYIYVLCIFSLYTDTIRRNCFS